jgi:hypothetical protein
VDDDCIIGVEISLEPFQQGGMIPKRTLAATERMDGKRILVQKGRFRIIETHHLVEASFGL